KKCWTTQPGWRNSCDAETSRHHRVCSAKRKARGGVSPACGMRNDHRMNGHVIIAADVRQFDRLINKDGVFSTHKALKTLVRTAVPLNKSRVRSHPAVSRRPHPTSRRELNDSPHRRAPCRGTPNRTSLSRRGSPAAGTACRRGETPACQEGTPP